MGNVNLEGPKLRSKEKKLSQHNVKPKKKCVCGKGLGYMQDKCRACQKTAQNGNAGCI